MSKKKIVILLPLLIALAVGASFILANTGAKPFSYQWTTVLGAPTGSLQIKAMKTDSTGNVYVAGNFTSTFAGATSAGGSDVFVRKYAPTGAVLWTKTIGGLYNDVAYALAVNSAGEVIVGGLFGGSVDFDPSSGTDAKQGLPMYNGFLIKLTSNGQYLWSKILKQTVVSAVAVDASDAIFYAGAFQSRQTGESGHGFTNTVNLNPNGGTDPKISKNIYTPGWGLPSSGGVETSFASSFKPDLFLSKLSADGTTYYWSQTLGETGQGFVPTALAVKGSAVYLAGIKGFSGDEKAFLVKYATDYTTSYAWLRTDTARSAPADMALDSAGNVYVAGIAGFSNSLASLNYFNISFPAVSGASRGYLKKYDANGQLQWQYVTGDSDPLTLLSVAVDAGGNVYAAGGFTGIANFHSDPNQQEFRASSGGTRDIFLLKLNADGTFAWVGTLGSFGVDGGERLLVADGGLYMAGLFSGGFNFDFTGGNDYISSVSPQSAFLTKLAFYNATTGSIKGTVISAAGATHMRIGNAVVTLEGTTYATTTAADGTFAFLDIQPGDYTLKVLADNFDAVTQTVAVTAGATATPSISLSFLCSLVNAGVRGQVMSTAGNANLLIGNAAVTLLDNSGNAVYATTSDASGYFVFSNVTPGSYTVRIAADNFETVNRQVTVSSGATVNMAASQTQLGVQCFNNEGAAGAIVIDPTTPTTLYTAIEGKGIYKSVNGGASWTPANTQPANTKIKALVIKPGDSSRLFAATYGGGVYTSVNSGVDWSVCANANLTNLNLVSMTIDGDGKLYAGSEAGVFVSLDDCASWSARNAGLTE